MKIGWIIVGIIIAVCIFLFFPNLFQIIVSGVQSLIHFLTTFGQLHGNITNITGV